MPGVLEISERGKQCFCTAKIKVLILILFKTHASKADVTFCEESVGSANVVLFDSNSSPGVIISF